MLNDRAATTPAVDRRRALAPFVAGVASASTAYIAAFTATSLAARQITGSAQLSGLPNAVGVAGTALGIALLSPVMARRGRRLGLLLGYLSAALGGIGALAAVILGSFVLLLAASLAYGAGNAALQLSRYAAADVVSHERRAAAIGTVVWASTVGAVLGPNLLQPASSVGGWFGRGGLEGAFAITVIGFLLAAGVIGRWAPRGVVAADPAASTTGRPGRRALLRSARVRIAIVGLVAGQAVMVLIMTMTPVHIRDSGQALGVVGLVISAHTLGMFALSPVSGRLVERLGALVVLYSGFAVLLLAALLAAAAPEHDVPILTTALFLLGFGWNLGFVSGSSLLAHEGNVRDRIALQGVADSLVWTAAVIASTASGFLLAAADFPVLALVGGAFLALPAAAVTLLRRTAAEPV